MLPTSCTLFVLLASFVLLTLLDYEKFESMSLPRQISYLSLHYKSFITGHIDDILAFAAVNDTLYTGSKDSTICIWDLRSKTQTGHLSGHSSTISALLATPDGHFLISGSWDTLITIWDLPSSTQIAVLRGHTDWITSLKYFEANNTLLSSSLDSTLKLWNLTSFSLITSFNNHTGQILSMDYSREFPIVVTGSSDKSIIVWDLVEVKLSAKFIAHTSQIITVSFSWETAYIASCDRDGVVKVWDLGGNHITDLRGVSAKFVKVLEGDVVLAITKNDMIVVWDLKEGKEVRRKQIEGLSGIVWGGYVDALGKYLFIGVGSKIKVYRIEDLERMEWFERYGEAYGVRVDWKKNVAAVELEDGSLGLWDLQRNSFIKNLGSECSATWKEMI